MSQPQDIAKENITSNGYDKEKPLHPLKIIVAGAGIAGLSVAISLQLARFSVHVFERAKAVSEVGSGLGLYPNATRLLDAWGMKEALREIALSFNDVFLLRYSGGEVLLHRKYDATKAYGSPQLTFHRATLQQILYDHAVKVGVSVTFNKKIVNVDLNTPTLFFSDNSEASGDLIIGADGVRSLVRTHIVQENADDFELPLAPTSAIRIHVPLIGMETDPDLKLLMDHPALHQWFGPGAACVGYPMNTAEGPVYALAVTYPEENMAGEWSKKADPSLAQDLLKNFEPRIQHMVEQADQDDFTIWALTQLPPLKSWASKNGRVVLCGDAAHALLPHLGQGAAMAIEDAAVLTSCLVRATSLSSLPRLVSAYEALRKPRVDRLKAGAHENMETWVFEDGPAQRARDNALRAAQSSGAEDESMRGPEHNRSIMDETAPPASSAFRAWLMMTDVREDATKYLDNLP